MLCCAVLSFVAVLMLQYNALSRCAVLMSAFGCKLVSVIEQTLYYMHVAHSVIEDSVARHYQYI